MKIIDNLGFSGNYNMIADSFKLSPIAINARTTIAGVSINMGGTLDPYMVNEKGRRIDEYAWNHLSGIRKLGRLTTANMSFGLNFQSKQGKKGNSTGEKENEEEEKKTPNPFQPEYVAFKVPWTLGLDYTMFYSKTYSSTGVAKQTLNQGVSFRGSLTLTENWDMNMNTNFDVSSMKFSFTTFSVSRKMHCWNMSFNFVPFGDRKSYSFNLSASSSILQDLKISKQSSWRDN